MSSAEYRGTMAAGRVGGLFGGKVKNASFHRMDLIVFLKLALASRVSIARSTRAIATP